MDKLLAVARREFLATVRTRAFLLSVVLMPALIVGAIFGAQLLDDASRKEVVPLRKIGVVDGSGVLSAPLAAQIAAANAERPSQPFELVPLPVDTGEQQARELVGEGRLYALLLIAPDAVTGDGGATIARRDNQLQAGKQIERMLHQAIVAVRLAAMNIDPGLLVAAQRPVPVRAIDPQSGGAVQTNEFARIMTPFAFMFLLFMSTFTISMGLLTTVIEEKSSRVVEVLLSAVTPGQLMAGKIIGMAAVGFLLMAVWGGVGYAAAQRFQAADLVGSYRFAMVLLYFVPGFLLIAAIQAAIGSACNELKEAQSMNFPISLITIVPMVFWFYITEHPTSLAAVALSFVPPITPFVMILRVCADPDTPAWQIVTTLALLWGSVGVAVWGAAKIFRVGVLMYGKPPSLRELFRWVRYT